MLQALALRYRPRNFSELVGQEAVSTSLTHALDESRLTHAYLFSGLRGSGKTSSARIFSKALVCDHGPTSRPCEQCANCIAANEGRHIDIIEMDAASHRGIDDIKGLIEQTKYAPAIARFKIFIIDEVHMLSTPAFNALLKTLEEPPPYVKFILATTDPLKLPATVLSRTQHFRFRQISRPDVVAHLDFILNRENVPHEKEALEILARSGAGSLRDTLTLLDQAIIYAKGELTQSVVAQMLGLLDPQRIEEILALVMSGDKSAVSAAVAQLESYDAEMVIDEITANLKANFLAQSPKYSLLLYERFFRILSQARSMLSVSSDGGFVLGVMLFMMIEAINLKSIDEMIAVDAREKFADSQARAADFSASRAASNFTGGRSEAARFRAPAQTGQISASADGSNLTGVNAAKLASQNGAALEQNLSAQTLTGSANLSAQTPQEPGGQTSAAKTQNPAYEAFLAKIYDRSFDLGECFKDCIEFLDFSSGCMSLASSAAGDDQRRLRESSKVILQILRSLFGESAKIKITPKQSPEIVGAEQKDAAANLTAKSTANLDDERGSADKFEGNETVSGLESAKFDAGGSVENLNQNAQAQEPSNLTGNLFAGGSEERTATPLVQNLDAKFEGGEQDEQTENLTQQTQAQTANDSALSEQTNSDSPMGKTEPLNLNENAANLTQNSQTQAGLVQPAEPKFAPDFESMRDDTHDFHEAYSLKFKTDEGVATGADLAFLDDELRLLESQNAAKTEQKPSGAAKFNQNSAPQTASFGEPPFDSDGVSEMFSEAADYEGIAAPFEQDASEPASAAARQNLEPRQNGDNVFGSLVKTSTQGALADFVSRNGAPFDAAKLSGDKLQDEANFDDSSSNEANLSSQNPAQNLTAKLQTDPKAAKNQAVLKEAKRLFGEPEILEI
ncbi:DNA polymerase III, subunit gamma and tau [Campylobacter rectus RM3267]|uniref:DNA-directed DNA polymerase n=2 Tax=Campylobacter rectus TaxID=203 RepID=A0A6G5QPH1_CAMRE|nr:DNA polymerase III, subunit gamma and tau [Campylobacter rectus RM3267]QCD47356.1 DNA polymerase III, gamma and tau subunits [Campylobacter rectus]